METVKVKTEGSSCQLKILSHLIMKSQDKMLQLPHDVLGRDPDLSGSYSNLYHKKTLISESHDQSVGNHKGLLEWTC